MTNSAHLCILSVITIFVANKCIGKVVVGASLLSANQSTYMLIEFNIKIYY